MFVGRGEVQPPPAERALEPATQGLVELQPDTAGRVERLVEAGAKVDVAVGAGTEAWIGFDLELRVGQAEAFRVAAARQHGADRRHPAQRGRGFLPRETVVIEPVHGVRELRRPGAQLRVEPLAQRSCADVAGLARQHGIYSAAGLLWLAEAIEGARAVQQPARIVGLLLQAVGGDAVQALVLTRPPLDVGERDPRIRVGGRLLQHLLQLAPGIVIAPGPRQHQPVEQPRVDVARAGGQLGLEDAKRLGPSARGRRLARLCQDDLGGALLRIGGRGWCDDGQETEQEEARTRTTHRWRYRRRAGIGAEGCNPVRPAAWSCTSRSGMD